MHRFLVVVERARGNYSAYSPDLPGCAATGSTREQAIRRMHQAIEIHIEGLREDRSRSPSPRPRRSLSLFPSPRPRWSGTTDDQTRTPTATPTPEVEGPGRGERTQGEELSVPYRLRGAG